MQAGGSAAVGGDVVAKPHLSFVAMPPDRGSRLVKVLAVEPDAGEGILATAQACKGEEHSLQTPTHTAMCMHLVVIYTTYVLVHMTYAHICHMWA